MVQVNQKTKKSTKKAVSLQNVANARAYITATFNNTIITITDQNGATLLWGSAGNLGFKGARKSTPYAATTAAENVAKRAREKGVSSLEIYLKGPGPGRDAAIRAFKAAGLNISMIADVTPIPHNGPRANKRRRV